MSGLRIVLEESDSASLLRSVEEVSLHSPDADEEYDNTETLLPPLPETEDEISSAKESPLMPTASMMSPVSMSAAIQNRPAISPRVFSSPSTLKERQQFTEAPEIQGMDLSSFNLDPSVFSFPSIDPSPPAQSASSGLSKSHSSSSINTSPLKRLKSFKSGLRRFSLSRKSSAGSAAPPMADLSAFSSTPALVHSSSGKQATYPMQTDTCSNDASSSSSASESLRSSTFSSSAPGNTNGHNTHTAVSTPIGPSHVHNSSQGSSIMAKQRRRTMSQSNSATSTTPPLPSPIITLSENLSSCNKNLSTIEQNFFESLAGEPPMSGGNVDSNVDSISLLNSSDVLIDYSIYLSQHKKSVETAYELSKSKLASSGWCSGSDIENLLLHRDSVLSQIDSKLLRIEEKLNADFNMSILNNPQVDMKCPPRANSASKVPMSPSLKDLESRCLFATNSNLLS